MPYKLVRAGNGYYVENILTGRRYSRRPMMEMMAKKQRDILAMAEPTRSYVHGGIIQSEVNGRPPKYVSFRVPTAGVDHVPILAQKGELMIPKKYASMVNDYLHSKNIHLPD